MNQPREQPHQWIVSPAFDLLFICNVWWVVAGLPWLVGDSNESAVSFWQIYFLTTPHRWLTLAMVATDPDRREGRGKLFISLAIIFAVIVAGVRGLRGAFTCLTIIDYVWNSWHFAAQHGGILRAYSRKAGGGRPKWETYSVRVLVVYVILRLVGWLVGWTETLPGAELALNVIDWVVLAFPTSLLILELCDRPRERIPKIAYLASVVCLYGALLLSLKFGYRRSLTALATASAAFHAVEYMAFVTHYARRRQNHGSNSLFRSMAKNWAQILALYLIAFGLFSAWAPGESLDGALGRDPSKGLDWRATLASFWVGANLWAAYLHYAFDGMIWKLRKPSTAKTLGVEVKA